MKPYTLKFYGSFGLFFSFYYFRINRCHFSTPLLLHISKYCLEKEVTTILPSLSLAGLYSSHTHYFIAPWQLALLAFLLPSVIHFNLFPFSPISYKFDCFSCFQGYILYLWKCTINSSISDGDNSSNCMLPGCHGNQFVSLSSSLVGLLM